ncbi:MAG: acyl carrier protein [Gammaproteobacteria bacterium]|nr:acyl carrier protein [Gammaproteobacteria bacterium]
MSSTFEKLSRILNEDMHWPKPGEEIKPETNLIDDLGMDSLDAVELVMAVEEEFGIEVPDNVAETCITVQDCVKTIDAALMGDA